MHIVSHWNSLRAAMKKKFPQILMKGVLPVCDNAWIENCSDSGGLSWNVQHVVLIWNQATIICFLLYRIIYANFKVMMTWRCGWNCRTQTSINRECKSLFHDITNVSMLVGTTIKINMAVIEWHVYCFLDLEINNSEYMTHKLIFGQSLWRNLCSCCSRKW